jgi:hypothetical protein
MFSFCMLRFTFYNCTSVHFLQTFLVDPAAQASGKLYEDIILTLFPYSYLGAVVQYQDMFVLVTRSAQGIYFGDCYDGVSGIFFSDPHLPRYERKYEEYTDHKCRISENRFPFYDIQR